MLRGKVDVKWFLTDEHEKESAYVFEDKAECDLLGRGIETAMFSSPTASAGQRVLDPIVERNTI